MINKQQIFPMLLLFLNIYSTPVFGAQSFVYANIEANDLTISLNDSRKFIGFGDIEIDSIKCSDGILGLCFTSESILFVLPEKNKKITNENWTSIRSSSGKYLVLGASFELDKVVITKLDGNVFTYWFSEKSGVLFIKIKLKDISSFFILKGNCGYGATTGCEDST